MPAVGQHSGLARELNRGLLPQPESESFPELVELYWQAWESAWRHVREVPGAPQSPYMDEGFDAKTIWIWDTCFMVAFCKYGATQFPGVESLGNFYGPMHCGMDSPLKIQHPDNPPLFAWLEWENARHTGDVDRLERIWREGFLQRHYRFFLNQPTPRTQVPSYARYHNDLYWNGTGFLWSGVASGMDNTPRGRGTPPHAYDGHERILWFDAMAQQGLSAGAMAEIAGCVGDLDGKAFYRREHAAWRERINALHWDCEDQCFYDVLAEDPAAFVKVKTPAVYWPLLAGLCDAPQAAQLAALARDPEVFGGPVPFPSLARNDTEFEVTGHYWRGGVWLPLVYMACKALERNGHAADADAAAWDLLQHMSRTYATYRPASIWECYQPVEPLPATRQDGTGVVRPDFCGWSALGPISLFIENVMGLRRVDAIDKVVVWDCGRAGHYGLRNVRVGAGSIDLLHHADGRIQVTSSISLTLILNGKSHAIDAGEHDLTPEGAALLF